MKKLLFILAICACIGAGCSKKIYVPVEKTHTEFRDKLVRDSIFIHDSTVVVRTGDTVFYTRIKYMFRDKFRSDTVIITDTIPKIVVQKESITKEVVPKWCWWLVMAVLGYILFRVIKWKLK